ncbi:carboxypeptidase-like regulatory domain-containing protein [Oryzomonas sagensis]|uniref:Carboxypeptidase-like regulatory domain-containing protein n=1 Tax=Oryzomonas sagensis TaxID=2603857 RepID=A0ABQ6TPJ5_9BACT|nr:carboxypeptidase regulatory-like domain-containing protein [Oryzomonas sagensis]KAB0670220.1 carboxypeptidase-like regulatory domain-containing protein [Oryzomonas sagensis]
MFGKFIIATLFGISCISLSGCIGKGDDALRQNAPHSPASNATAAAIKPTLISGTVLREDRVTPISGVRVVLKRKTQAAVVSSADTDHIGNFSLAGPFSRDDYTIEIDSPEYAGAKTILVELNRDNWHEIIASKR